MRIEVKGRNVPVSDDLREHVAKRFRKIGKQVSELAELEVEVFEERNPAIADSQVAEATLHLKGVTLRARDASPGPDALDQPVRRGAAVQVKRHRDKRRKRREARAAAAGAPSAPVDAAGRAPRAAYSRGGLKRRLRPSGRPGFVPPGGPRGPATTAATLDPMSILDRALRMGEAKKFKSYEQRVGRINALRARARALHRRASCARPPTSCASAPGAARASTSCCTSASRWCARPAGGRWGCATSTSS